MNHPHVDVAILAAAFDRSLLTNEELREAALVAAGLRQWRDEPNEVVVQRDDLQALLDYFADGHCGPFGLRTQRLKDALDDG